MGSDPTPQIETLARRLHLQCRSISMGQGQEVHARALLSTFMVEGGALLYIFRLHFDSIFFVPQAGFSFKTVTWDWNL